MATQEEWREIACQRSLGERGSQTGNIHNDAGYNDYLRQQERNRAFEADAFGNVSTPASSGSVSPLSRRGGGISPAITLALIAGMGAIYYWGTFTAAGAAFFATLIGAKLLVLFFASDVGFLFVMLLELAIKALLFAALVAMMWVIGGPRSAMWFLGGIATLGALGLGFRYLSYRYHKFATTPFGAKIDRTLSIAWTTAVFAAIGFGGYWLYDQFTK